MEVRANYSNRLIPQNFDEYFDSSGYVDFMTSNSFMVGLKFFNPLYYIPFMPIYPFLLYQLQRTVISSLYK